jgi:hypothetical protein
VKAIIFILLSIFLSPLGLHAEEGVSLIDVKVEPLYRIDGSFEVAATPSQVWQVLTDYEELAGIVSSMKRSHVEYRGADGLRVRQTARGHFLFLSKDVELFLAVKESPEKQISFLDLSKTSFPIYQGSWNLESLSGTVKVRYQLELSRGAMAPEFLERSLFKDNASSLLQEFKAEILRRIEGEKKKP